MSNIRFAPEVAADLEGSYDFIARENAEAGSRFMRMADATFEMLANNPYIGVHKEFGSENLSDMRFFRIKNFENYLIFYRPIADGIEVLRIIHGAKDLSREFKKS